MQAAAHTPGGYGGVSQAVGREFTRKDGSAFETPPEEATDHEIAEGIRGGKYASPTQVGTFWLFDMRVTGTGMAWRESLGEWAHRDPKEWLSPEFVERAASVPVIWLHPDGSGLNTEEYRERAIGNTVLSYVKDDEVWAVAKIFDADAAEAMQTTHRSTSPGVTPPKGSIAVELNNGDKVLDEGLPLVLDHLAICEMGVWDKDGPPAGIRLDALLRKADTVAEKTKEEIDDEQRRADAMELDAFRKADKAKKDAEEKEREDKRRKDESDKEAIEAAEKEKADKAKKDAKRKDWETKKDSESEEEFEKRADSRMDGESDEEYEDRKKDRKAKKDAAMAKKEQVDADRGTDDIKDSVAVLQATLKRQAEQIAAMTAQPSIGDSNEIAKAWGRWDSLYQMLGEQTPRNYPGEKPRAYLRRLADGVRKFTVSFPNYVFHDSQQAQDFDAVSNLIFAEALAHSKQPTVTKGSIREVVTHPNGKTRTEFFGDQSLIWGPFEHPTDFYVKKINRPVGNVYGES